MAQSSNSTTLHEGEEEYGCLRAWGGRHPHPQPQQNYMEWGGVSHQANTEQTKARDVHDRETLAEASKRGTFLASSGAQ